MNWHVYQVNVQPGRRADLLQLSRGYVEECVREEPGTLSFNFLLDEEDEDRYFAIEQYTDKAAQVAHAHGAVIQRWAPRIIPLLAGPPILIAGGEQVEF